MLEGRRNILLFSCAAAALLLQIAAFGFDGDCAVAGLMGIHISRLQEFPLYFWANQYSGTLSSYIAALLFGLFGVSKFMAALPGILISWIWIFCQYRLGVIILGRNYSWAVLLLCLFPPPNILHYAIFSAGIHAETLAFTSLLMLLSAYRVTAPAGKGWGFYVAAGLAAGFGQWLSPGMLPASACMAVIFIALERKNFLKDCLPFLLGGFAAGYMPALVYDAGSHGAGALRLGGRFLDLDRTFLVAPDKSAVIIGRLLDKVLHIPASAAGLVRYFSDAAGLWTGLALAAGAGFSAARVLKAGAGNFPVAEDIPLVYACFFSLFYILILSAPPALRYAVPLYAAAPLLIASGLKYCSGIWRPAARLLLAAMLALNLYGIFGNMRRKPGYDIDKLCGRVEVSGIKYAYSDYQTAYLLTFLTMERTIVSPTLLHPSFSDRYPEYTRRVRESASPAFIINDVLFPELSTSIARRLKAAGAAFVSEDCAGYTIISGVSKNIKPEELGLVETE